MYLFNKTAMNMYRLLGQLLILISVYFYRIEKHPKNVKSLNKRKTEQRVPMK